MITSTAELDAVCAAMERECAASVTRLLDHAKAHVQHAQGQAVVADWTGMQWWNHSQGASLVVNRRDASGFGFPTVVGEIFDPRFARRATAADAAHASHH